MNEIELKINKSDKGAFVIQRNEELLAELQFEISQNTLTVLHTEVTDMLKRRGIAKKLVDTMVAYARQNDFKVHPLCSYTLKQFRKNPEKYGDVWLKKN